MCHVNGELLIFGGSDEAIVADDAAHNRNREVDTHVYHIRPRLKRRPMVDKWLPLTKRKVRHEVSMASEVSALLHLVEKAEQERAAAHAPSVPVPRRVSTTREAVTAAPPTASRAGGASAAARESGRGLRGQPTPSGAEEPRRTIPPGIHLDPTGVTSRAFRIFGPAQAMRLSDSRRHKMNTVMCIQVGGRVGASPSLEREVPRSGRDRGSL